MRQFSTNAVLNHIDGHITLPPTMHHAKRILNFTELPSQLTTDMGLARPTVPRFSNVCKPPKSIDGKYVLL